MTVGLFHEIVKIYSVTQQYADNLTPNLSTLNNTVNMTNNHVLELFCVL